MKIGKSYLPESAISSFVVLPWTLSCFGPELGDVLGFEAPNKYASAAPAAQETCGHPIAHVCGCIDVGWFGNGGLIADGRSENNVLILFVSWIESFMVERR